MIFGSWSQIRKVENNNSMASPLTQGHSELEATLLGPKRPDPDFDSDFYIKASSRLPCMKYRAVMPLH
ncbi:Uncharacterized protein DBV15_10572 [Temnothorax longispinosus]|uniref:Uncharacterized protein n=1 Tax=Temnothorax longispinosus TaxID=300112 RepID=A0A4S2JNC9_9HYME|nr:Uncharacterized protein DBV15_10572 [Temnothorax longispinosus]